MKPVTRAKLAWFKWTGIFLIPVLVCVASMLLCVLASKLNINGADQAFEDFNGLVDHMLSIRDRKAHVAYRGYELVIED